MKTRTHFRLPGNFKFLPALTFVAVAIIGLSSCSENKDTEVISKELNTKLLPPPPPPPPSEIVIKRSGQPGEEPYVAVEEMPMFPGGDAELLKYIGENTKYPPSAKEQNIQGRVIIRFCITAEGSVSQVSVIKGVDQALDEEAMRVVSTLPDFEPGRQGGKPVPVWYMVPITFALK